MFQRGALWGAALLLCAPLLFLALRPGEAPPELWSHLRAVMLPEVLRQTGVLLVGVGAGALLLGIGFAWLVVRHEFPGRRLLEPMLAVPLAFPAYVLAYIYVAGFAFDAPLASYWRGIGLPAAAFPEVRSLTGAVLLLTLTLYPYIYLLMRASLLRQGSTAYEAARTLGAGPWAAFIRVVLPATRVAWLGGLGLVLLETLADFGAMRMLGRDTLTTLVLQSWIGLGSLALAAQLALAMLAAVVLVLGLLLALDRRRVVPAAGSRPPERHRLSGGRALLATAAAASVVGFGVVWPFAQLLLWVPWPDLATAIPWAAVRSTVLIAGLAAIASVLLGLAFAAVRRRHPADRWLAAAESVAGLGYAVPGAVMAVAVFWFLSSTEQALGPFAAGLSTGVLALVLALLMRFQRVGLTATAAALAALRPSLMQSAAVLGHTPRQRWWRVGLPVLQPGLIAAFLLVFVEVMKELPATLMLRPFGWDTLAIEVYTRTSEGLWREASVPALMLALVGLLPVLLLLRDGGAWSVRRPQA
ncbi:iron ABC transporter permease [Silanimonas sp.]|uniref:ABC transporter permease n=1 Tax=Silanimonas sp. TaxID=1929290 RepID=UPI001BC5F924|nr:iron ABC transporter permease [Silanimonas sp.]MBS3897130.1 iron ABC transporter permease [Silanimonas sp.]